MKHQRRFSLVELLVIIGLVALIISIVLPSYRRMQEPGGRVPCASNMRQIGQALLLYSLDHGGRYPQKLEELLKEISGEQLVCAQTGEPAVFIRPGAIAADLTADDVVVYEPLSAHDNEGSNVLFGDGHVEFVWAKDLNDMLARPSTLPTKNSARQE